LANDNAIMAIGNERDPKSSPESPDTHPPGEANSAAAVGEVSGEEDVLRMSIGSGLMKQVTPTTTTEEHIAVAKVCPQCGSEYETGDRFCPKDGAPLRPKGSGDPMIGRVIADRYLILARLGEGGMGRVYVAEHVKMNRQCAIKVMNPNLLNDSESTTRFAREASNAARILHPNVAAVFDYGESDRTVYLVMEYVDGESLSTVLAREGALDPRRAIDISRQIADGLTAAHELGIVHRDLKPDNVIIATKRDGREIAKVVDFGIAKALSDLPQDSLTRSGLVIGTPEYMSPEQLLGDPVDARADIYALGCMLYQMLTGGQPFDATTREQMIRRRLHEPPPHLQTAMPEIPRRLDTLIAHMLARSPNERLASAAEVSASLDPALALAGWTPPSGNVRVSSSARNPRAAPTVIGSTFDLGMQPTVAMELAKASPKRVVFGSLAGSVVLLSGLFLWSQRSALSSAQQPPVTVVSPAAPAPIASAPIADTTTKAVVDSSAAAAAIKPPAAKAESSTRTAKKPELPPEEAAIRRTLDHFAMVVANGEIAVQKEFPAISPSLLDGLRRIYNQNEQIKTRATYGTLSIEGTRAELPYSVRLNYQDRSSKQPGTFLFQLRAVLIKRAGKWEIADLAQAP
jgi:serine/threonine protein kinase